MIPDYEEYEEDDESEELTVETESSLTYAMNLNTMRFTGKIDGADALQQAIYKILNTERYKYGIYSWDYGIELEDLRGKPMIYVMSEIPNRIKDALEADDRIESVDEFEVEASDRSTLTVSFTVHQASGDDISIESEVEI